MLERAMYVGRTPVELGLKYNSRMPIGSGWFYCPGCEQVPHARGVLASGAGGLLRSVHAVRHALEAVQVCRRTRGTGRGPVNLTHPVIDAWVNEKGIPQIENPGMKAEWREWLWNLRGQYV